MVYILVGAVIFALALGILSDKSEKAHNEKNSQSKDEWRLLEEYLSSEDEDD